MVNLARKYWGQTLHLHVMISSKFVFLCSSSPWFLFGKKKYCFCLLIVELNNQCNANLSHSQINCMHYLMNSEHFYQTMMTIFLLICRESDDNFVSMYLMIEESLKNKGVRILFLGVLASFIGLSIVRVSNPLPKYSFGRRLPEVYLRCV